MGFRIYLVSVAVAYTQVFACREDYAVVCGMTTEGVSILPMSCSDNRYVVPCGPLGLPYKSELGEGGVHVEFQFTGQVSQLVVATTSDMPPTFLPVPPPPVVRVTSIQFQGYTPRRGTTVLKVWHLQFSDGSSNNYTRFWRLPVCPEGTPLDDLETGFSMRIYDAEVDGALQPTNPLDPNGPTGAVATL